MKCVLALACVAYVASGAAVTPTVAPISSTYAYVVPATTTAQAYCNIGNPYAVAYVGADSSPGANFTFYPFAPTPSGPTPCEFYDGTGTTNDVLYLTCAPGYTGPAAYPNGVAGNIVASGTNWNTGGSTSQPPNLLGNYLNTYNFQTNTSFVCTAITCNYTCVTSALSNGTGCLSSSGAYVYATTNNSVCAPGYFVVGNTNGSNIYSCPANGSVVSFTCSNSAAEIASFSQYALVVVGASAYSVPGACLCTIGSTTNLACPTGTAYAPSCTGCLTCPSGIARDERQTLGARAAYCPITITTLAGIQQCFRQAACAGAIHPSTDTCVINNATGLTIPCPTCPGGSKKLLLLLLLLLLIIPAVLLSLCCLLLLCLIRRKKTERNVHFATFDAGAPAIAAPPITVHATPLAAEVPFHHHHTTVHHASYAGPPHFDVGAPHAHVY